MDFFLHRKASSRNFRGSVFSFLGSEVKPYHGGAPGTYLTDHGPDSFCPSLFSERENSFHGGTKSQVLGDGPQVLS